MSEPSKFVIVPRFVWQGCQPAEIKVYCALASYADWDTGVCWPSRQTIADDAGVSLSTVKRALSKLRSIGAIEVSHRKKDDGKENTTNLYTLPFAINRPGGGATREPTWGHRRTRGGATSGPETTIREQQGLTPLKSDPSRCTHKPLDEEGYCTACGTEVA